MATSRAASVLERDGPKDGLISCRGRGSVKRRFPGRVNLLRRVKAGKCFGVEIIAAPETRAWSTITLATKAAGPREEFAETGRLVPASAPSLLADPIQSRANCRLAPFRPSGQSALAGPRAQA